MSHPLVSVIVPSYNHENYVIEALDSIKEQSYNNIELIIIDDGSTDDSRLQIKKWCQENKLSFSDLIYVEQPNNGVSSALNRGIKLSSGEFLSICASDDKFDEDKISMLVSYCEKNKKVKAIFTDAYLIDSSSKVISASAIRSRFHVSANFLHNFDCEDLVYFWCVFGPCQFFHKSIYEIYGHYDETLLVEDRDFWLRFISDNICYFYPKSLCYYRTHTGSATNGPSSPRKRRMRLHFAQSCVRRASLYSGLKRLFLESYRLDVIIWSIVVRLGLTGVVWQYCRSLVNRLLLIMVKRAV